jgi:hypothetical protein
MMTQSHQSIITERFCSRYSTGKRFFIQKLKINQENYLFAFCHFCICFAPLAFKLRAKKDKSKRAKRRQILKGNNLSKGPKLFCSKFTI